MILIIRSKVDPDKLILDFRKRKYQVHIEPFMYFKRLYPKILLDPNAHYLVSSLQVINVLKKNKKIICNGNFLAIGKKVKKELQLIGVNKIHHFFEDSYQLLNFIKKDKRIKHIRHLTGTVTNEVLKGISKKKGIKYTIKKVYVVKFKKEVSPRLRKLISNQEVKIMIHYSLKVTDEFFKRLRKGEKSFFKTNITHICMSNRISRGLKKIGVDEKKLKTSKKPNHQSMMLLLKHIK